MRREYGRDEARASLHITFPPSIEVFGTNDGVLARLPKGRRISLVLPLDSPDPSFPPRCISREDVEFNPSGAILHLVIRAANNAAVAAPVRQAGGRSSKVFIFGYYFFHNFVHCVQHCHRMDHQSFRSTCRLYFS